MEMKRLSLIATIVVIALLAVGVGYAYTAFTSNSGNHSEVGYVTLTQVGTPTPYTFADDITVELATYNEIDSHTTYYKVANELVLVGDATSADKTYRCAKLGEIELHAELSGNVNPPAKIEVTVAGSTNFAPAGKWVYIVGSEIDSQAAANAKNVDIYSVKGSTTDWSNAEKIVLPYTNNAYTNAKVCIYYGYLDSNTIVKSGLHFINDTTIPTNLNDASILFKGEAASVKHTVTYNANGGTGDSVVITTANTTFHLVKDPASIGFTAPADKKFKGWSEQTSGDVITTDTITLTTDKTLYAIWEDA